MKKSAVVTITFTVTFLGAVCAPRGARAQQTDTNPPLPNVLLLIDNSGSMDRMIDGTLPESNPGTPGHPGTICNCTEVPGNPPTANCNWSQQPSSPNRWGILTQALTGSIKGGYNCISMPRTSGSTFTTEYQIDNQPPYDTGYYLNYYRPIAEDTSGTTPAACVFAPGLLPGANPGFGVGPNGAGSGNLGVGSGQAATDFPSSAVITRPYGQYTNTTPNSCQFNQYSDGVIPSFTSFVRFGLMTFDNDPSQGTGVQGTPLLVNNNPAADPESLATGAFLGMWSYYPNWSTGASCPYVGNPAACATATTMAVGSRNPAAPPWEGRLIGFPTTNDLTTQEQTNSNVASVINSTRPYGGTPLAGMFYDAQYYFWSDPTGPQQTDPLVQASVAASKTPDAGGTPPCRQEFIILLTDGAPNEDMRPDCAASGSPPGNCPFPLLPEQVAANLYAGTATGTSVTTFVIGFAVSSVQNPDGSNVDCSSLVTNGTLASQCSGGGDGGAMLPQYASCCELQRIALAGTGNNPQSTSAFFADSPEALQNALSTILGQVSSQATSRTVPAYAPTASAAFSSTAAGTNTTNAEVFLASFDPGVDKPWTGDVLRQRYTCQYAATTSSFSVPSPTIDPTQGDDFGKNLNSNAGSLPRTFIAFEPAAVVENSVTVHDSTLTIRPYITTTPADGLPIYGATTYAGGVSTLISGITPDAMNITDNTCAYTSSTPPYTPATLTASNCETAVLDFETASAWGGSPATFPFQSRVGSALGDIYHATPVDVGPPGSLLQDPLYTAFEGSINPPRKNIVYAASNDGILHAFWADETTLENNEEWALIPPASLANLAPSYPSSHEFLLDGSPVVKDVVWDRSASATAASPWHTMLVEGFGEASTLPGYIAVDVTQPAPTQLTTVSGTVPSASPPNAPTLRWQLSTVPSSNFPLFGQHSGTPAITTLFMDPGDGQGARDIGVAVLPGGQTGTATTSAGNGSSCMRWSSIPAYSGRYTNTSSAPTSGYTARTAVRCWGSPAVPTTPVPGRDLVIARLDTGEILRVFTRLPEVQTFTGDTLLAAGRITDVPFDSPIIGTPIVYPADVGTDTTKIFVGDADGTLWRIDVSDPLPANWTGGLYLDAYNTTVDTNTTAWSDGEPFGVPPTLSLNAAGQLVMNAATTTTDSFDTSGIYFIYSITETVQAAALHAQVNWYIGSPLTPSTSTVVNKPVPNLLTGERVSGPMTVFNGELFFATYAANATSSTSSCNQGLARVWGVDYQTAYPSEPAGDGGNPLLNDLPPNPPTNIVPFVVPSQSTGNSALTGVVIPGVSIRATPACAAVGTGGVNPLGGGSYNSIGASSPSSFSLFAQLGQANPSGAGANTLNIGLNPPLIPMRIDSWAGVFE